MGYSRANTSDSPSQGRTLLSRNIAQRAVHKILEQQVRLGPDRLDRPIFTSKDVVLQNLIILGAFTQKYP